MMSENFITAHYNLKYDPQNGDIEEDKSSKNLKVVVPPNGSWLIRFTGPANSNHSPSSFSSSSSNLQFRLYRSITWEPRKRVALKRTFCPGW